MCVCVCDCDYSCEAIFYKFSWRAKSHEIIRARKELFFIQVKSRIVFLNNIRNENELIGKLCHSQVIYMQEKYDIFFLNTRLEKKI